MKNLPRFARISMAILLTGYCSLAVASAVAAQLASEIEIADVFAGAGFFVSLILALVVNAHKTSVNDMKDAMKANRADLDRLGSKTDENREMIHQNDRFALASYMKRNELSDLIVAALAPLLVQLSHVEKQISEIRECLNHSEH